MRRKDKNLLIGAISLLIAGLLIVNVLSIFSNNIAHSKMSMGEKRDSFIFLKNEIQEELREQEKYKCCLEKPCTYCIEKTPGHGEGAICDCLGDVMNGVHPCGECIGEILEGHGNPYAAKYFANAIAEKVGDEHMDTLKKIVEEKYGVPVEEQFDF